jgi:hypothetical protein
MKKSVLGRLGKLPLGTVAIDLKAYPFTTIAVVTAANFTRFGLQDKDNYQAKRLTVDNSCSSFISRTWNYI